MKKEIKEANDILDEIDEMLEREKKEHVISIRIREERDK